jgi:hypothetical protein
MSLDSAVLARLVRAANPMTRCRTAQHSADITNVKYSGAQWENAPHQRQDAEQVLPKDKAEDENSYACDGTKYAPTGTVEKARET